jgi:radical SAM superfamily enzyme YgiQ (UPF0313 family)
MKLHLIAPSRKRKTYLFNREFMPPLGLMYLAAHTPKEVKVRLIDEMVEHIDFTDTPDLVGITTMTATAARAYEIADRYRELGVKVVLGGIHASMVPEEALEHADSVVVGEAEAIWPRVVSDADADRLESLYRQEDFIDFKRPPLPRRDLVDPKRYWIAKGIQTSRGCPHDCNFCSVTAFNGRRCRMRELDNVLAEVESLSRSNLARRQVVAFVDDNIAASPNRSKQLFKALIPMKIVWGSQACITFARDEELVGLAAESGCRFLLIGLETLSPRALAEMGKRQNKVEQYEDALRLFKKYGIRVLCTFIFGFDSDDESIFSDTLEFAVRNKMTLAQFNMLTPYPGTRLYRRLLAENRVEPRFWLDPSWISRVVFKPKTMSAERLYERTGQVMQDFYSYRSIIKRISSHRYWDYSLVANLIFHHFTAPL